MNSISEQLEHSSFFEDMARSHLEALANKASTMVVAPGEHVFDQDTPADACFVLVRGRVRLDYRILHGLEDDEGASEPEITVRRYEDPGRFLGWSALVEPYRYRGSVIAEVPTELVRIGHEVLMDYLCDPPGFRRSNHATLDRDTRQPAARNPRPHDSPSLTRMRLPLFARS